MLTEAVREFMRKNCMTIDGEIKIILAFLSSRW